MKHSRGEPSRLHCLLHLDYRARTGKLPEAAATLTGTLPEIGNERNALSLTGGIAETERKTETGTGMLCCIEKLSLKHILCNVTLHIRSHVPRQPVKASACVVGHTEAVVAEILTDIAVLQTGLPTEVGTHTTVAEIVETDIAVDHETDNSCSYMALQLDAYAQVFYCTSFYTPN